MNINPWTPQLESLKAICEQKAGKSFNSLLLNLYRNGDDKVSWHSDNESELGYEPCIASLSLGAVRRFKFRHLESREVVECSLPPGSLVVLRDPAIAELMTSDVTQLQWLSRGKSWPQPSRTAATPLPLDDDASTCESDQESSGGELRLAFD